MRPLEYIDRLRQKPPRERAHAAFLISASLTGLILLGWLAVLPFRFANQPSASAEPSLVSSGLSSVMAGFSDVVTQARSFSATSSPLQDLFGGSTFTASNEPVSPASSTDSGL